MRANTGDPKYAGYRTPPAGEYRFKITDMSNEVSQNTGNPYFNWEFTICGGEYDGCKVWDITTITEKALWRLVVLFKACGLGDVDFDTDEVEQVWHMLEGKRFSAKTYIDTYEGKDRAKIGEYLVPDDSAPASSDDESDVPY